jgi:hypothetical protein
MADAQLRRTVTGPKRVVLPPLATDSTRERSRMVSTGGPSL